MRKSFSNFKWGTSSFNEEILKNVKINVPVTDLGAIDLDYIDAYIRELEAARIRDLDKWLQVSGLDDCHLNPDEQRALDDWHEGRVRSERRKVVELFDVANTHCVLGEWVAGRKGKVPYVTASACNNSVSSYVDYKDEFIDRGNAIVIGGKTFVVTYQSEDFFSNDSHNLVLHLKDKRHRVRDVYLYLIGAINAGLSAQYSWGDSVSYKKIQKDEIVIPVSPSEEIDYDFMLRFIRATIKQTIRSVVAWKDRELALTRRRTGLDSGKSCYSAVLSNVAEALKYREYLPFYSLKAACGKFGADQLAEPTGWVRVRGLRRQNKKLYVVRAAGDSMEPLIRDGQLCVFEDRDKTCESDDIVLAEHAAIPGDEPLGSYAIKRISYVKKGAEYTDITLHPQNAKYKPIPIPNEGEFVRDFTVAGVYRKDVVCV